MNFKTEHIKTLVLMLLGIGFFSFAMPGDAFNFLQFSQTASDPLARFFQILFILFIISPPLIVVLLFLIWKELKARNKMK